eukprot:gene32965-biopygen21313
MNVTLGHFLAVGAILFDHPDPSIFTVLTSPSDVPGTANVDFVIFPPRWMVAEDTFRPPWFHRNTMSECMGLLYGAYDAKAEGFQPGALSLHNQMSGHGPDVASWQGASEADLKPHRIDATMAFMIESRWVFRPQKVGDARADQLLALPVHDLLVDRGIIAGLDPHRTNLTLQLAVETAPVLEAFGRSGAQAFEIVRRRGRQGHRIAVRLARSGLGEDPVGIDQTGEAPGAEPGNVIARHTAQIGQELRQQGVPRAQAEQLALWWSWSSPDLQPASGFWQAAEWLAVWSMPGSAAGAPWWAWASAGATPSACARVAE